MTQTRTPVERVVMCRADGNPINVLVVDHEDVDWTTVGATHDYAIRFVDG